MKSIAILGAGVGGMCMAIKAREAGYDQITIYEKADAIGGTWRDNTYPGAACDAPSHLYSLSFEPKPDWSCKFAGQPEILAYLQEVAAKHRIEDLCRFRTEIASASWDQRECSWTLTSTDGEVFGADVLVAAVGQLNRPQIPDIDGRDDFAGVAFHSARWNHDHNLEGRRVAVVGNGASAIQFVPEIATEVAHLDLYQRTPNWVFPRENAEYDAATKSKFRRSSLRRRLHRLGIYSRLEFAVGPAFVRPRSIGRPAARALGLGGEKVLKAVVADSSLRSKLTPNYPVGCKRILGSNDWYPALQLETTVVIETPIERIVSDGIVTADGNHHPADTIIYATGFDTTHFLAPIEITGRDGHRLHDDWADGAEAHRGVTVSAFPNLFMLYGPNTNLGHNSIIYMIEQQVHYILALLKEARAHGLDAVEVREEVQAKYNADIQKRMGSTVWESCNSWYRNQAGRVTNNWPGQTLSYWFMMRRAKLSDHIGYRRRARV